MSFNRLSGKDLIYVQGNGPKSWVEKYINLRKDVEHEDAFSKLFIEFIRDFYFRSCRIRLYTKESIRENKIFNNLNVLKSVVLTEDFFIYLVIRAHDENLFNLYCKIVNDTCLRWEKIISQIKKDKLFYENDEELYEKEKNLFSIYLKSITIPYFSNKYSDVLTKYLREEFLPESTYCFYIFDLLFRSEIKLNSSIIVENGVDCIPHLFFSKSFYDKVDTVIQSITYFNFKDIQDYKLVKDFNGEPENFTSLKLRLIKTFCPEIPVCDITDKTLDKQTVEKLTEIKQICRSKLII